MMTAETQHKDSMMTAETQHKDSMHGYNMHGYSPAVILLSCCCFSATAMLWYQFAHTVVAAPKATALASPLKSCCATDSATTVLTQRFYGALTPQPLNT
ncbi:hypothetical protein BaRGS_00012127 [Batillaria attramentaria]|uniref:Uncharacterized protein n=1 Tax=Batillaria attramentaria TaxID=370345 RepID=A0ABD0LBU1_9CAEN